VSCVSASFCAAVGNYTAATFNGSTWTRGQNEQLESPRSVSCPSTSFCVVGGEARPGYFTDNPNLFRANTNPESENGESRGNATPGRKAAKCVVPRVAGTTLGHARLLLKKAGCALGRVKHRKARKRLRGHVLAQSVRAHRTLKYRARVDLTVGR
jgi:hypothetical protein